ncbi:MAG: RodZ domain-containing protein [Pseudomonadota bacterium]
MDSFGEYLKKERESKSISLEEISAATKVRKILLEAIESNDIDKLPAEVFVIGFLKAYASYVGLDVDEVVLQYKMYIDDIGKNKFKKVKETSPEPKKPILSKILLIVSAIVLILIVFLYFYLYLGEKEEVKPQTDIISKPSVPASIPNEEAVTPTTPLPEETVKEVVTSDQGVNDQKVREKNLLVKASETTWVRVQIDDKPPFEILLKPGESLTWNAVNSFKLFIGNAGGIDLFYNGKSLGRLGDSGEVISLKLPNEKIM